MSAEHWLMFHLIAAGWSSALNVVEINHSRLVLFLLEGHHTQHFMQHKT